MKIFAKTFVYTLALLIFISVLANGLIYSLLPKAYTKQKQQALTDHANKLVAELKEVKRNEIASLMAKYAADIQADLEVNIGEEVYSIRTGGVITELSNNDSTDKYVTYGTEGQGTDRTNKSLTIIDVYNKEDSSVKENDEDLDNETNAILSISKGGSRELWTKRYFIMDGENGTLTVTITLAPVDEAVDVIMSILPLSFLLCVITAIAFSLLYARAITRPIKAISDETHRMTALERDARCKVKSKDEIGALASYVNDLYQNLLNTIQSLEIELQKVGAAERAKTDFLRAASHELKTPVTAVSVIIENMILGIGKYKNHDQCLPKCKELVDKL